MKRRCFYAFLTMGPLLASACTPVDQTLPNGAKIEGYHSPIFGSFTDVAGADFDVVNANQIDALAANPDSDAKVMAKEILEIGRDSNKVVGARAEVDDARAKARDALGPKGPR